MSGGKRSIILYSGLFMVGLALVSLTALATSSLFFPISGAKIDPSAGRALFAERCSGCHAVRPGQAGGMGPNLSNIGATAAFRKPDLDAAEYILESIQYPDEHRASEGGGHMPRGTAAGVSVEALRNLVAYLAGLGAQPDTRAVLSLTFDREALESEDRAGTPVSLKELQRGHELFAVSLGCTACHSILDEPGSSLYAPSLTKAGQLPEDYLRSSIRHPSDFISLGYRQADLALKDGSIIKGRLMRESDTTLEVLVRDEYGHPKSVPVKRVDVVSVRIDSRSPMPAYDLPAADERALISFLRFLTAEI